MASRRGTFLLLALLLLSGCGHWIHPTASPEQLRKDDYECRVENRYIYGNAFPVQDRRMYAYCMQVRGYQWMRGRN